MKPKKHPRANLNRFRFIFFQLGLIISLGITYFGIQHSFRDNPEYIQEQVKLDVISNDAPPVTEMQKQELPPPPPPPVPEVIEVVEDYEDVEESIIQSTETSQDEAIEQVVEVEAIVEQKVEEIIEEVPFVVIENVPVYPGCESEPSNDAKRLCMSKSIQKLVKEEFDTNLGAELGLDGINRVIVLFKIDQYGNVSQVQARGPHKALEAEAVRVVQLIPRMKPGLQRNRPVKVSYTLPILFEVRND